MNKETHRFIWQGIEVEVNYNPEWYAPFAHLEIKSINPEHAPLPITETGYLSRFHQQGIIEAHEGGVLGQVTAWLDEEAEKSEWKAHIEASRQGSLF